MDDDEIEELESLEMPLRCQICDISLSRQTPAARQAHYEEHFNDSPDNNATASGTHTTTLSNDPSTRSNTNRPGKKKALSFWNIDNQNVFWHRSQCSQPPPNFTPGLIPLLKQALLKSHAKGNTVRAALCYEGMVHVKSEWWDSKWGCGYRNFLMACTGLMDQQVQPLYFPALDRPTPPGVRNLQQWIEDAWKAGFDPEGAADLNHKLVGTSKWIGTAELYVAFLYRGIPSRLVDFPHVESGADAVIKWIENYFTSPLPSGMKAMRAKVKTTVGEALRWASPVTVTDRMPLVLQHHGHSRTIVGYEKHKNGTVNLLCFDPSKKPSAQIRKLAIAQYYSSRGESPPRGGKHKQSHPNVMDRIMHPRQYNNDDTISSPSNGSTSKRRRPKERRTQDSKRARGGSMSPDKEVIILDDDEPEIIDINPVSCTSNPKMNDNEELDYNKVLEPFRLRPKKVGKNDRYQILYFPLEDILTKQERWDKRIVTSEVVR